MSEPIERRLALLALQVRCLPRASRRSLEPLLNRADTALSALRVSQVLADEALIRRRLTEARMAG